MWQQWYLSQNRWTLAESLRAAGYRTAGFVDSSWITSRFGLTQGFDVYDSSAAEGPFAPHGSRDGGIRRTTALARAFLEDLGPEEPFLLFLHALDVHGAYLAKPSTWPYSTDSEPYDRERTRPAGGSPQAFGIIPTYIALGEVPSGELPSRMPTAPLERAYDEGIRFLDEELGRFLAFLGHAGILERSWLVFTADHGEMMSDSTLLFGHGVLDQDVTHVPLLIRPPGGCPGGRRVAEAVQLVDLYPTLVELAGLECRPPKHGRSLVPLLRNEEHEPGLVLVETGVTRQAMLVAGGWMLIELEPTKDLTEQVGMISHPLLMRNLPSLAELESRARKKGRGLLSWLDDVELKRDFFERLPQSGPTEELMTQMRTRKKYEAFLGFVRHVLKGPFYELYELKSDPEAEHDVAAQHPEKLGELKKLLKQEQLRRTQAWKNATAPAEPVVLPPAEIQALEALGYGGGDDDHDDDGSNDHGE